MDGMEEKMSVRLSLLQTNGASENPAASEDERQESQMHRDGTLPGKFFTVQLFT